jgi:hypothetical protein
MSRPPPEEDANLPDDAESRFLIGLWDSLERAQEIAVGRDVLGRLDEVLAHCEAATATIRRWRAERH